MHTFRFRSAATGLFVSAHQQNDLLTTAWRVEWSRSAGDQERYSSILRSSLRGIIDTTAVARTYSFDLKTAGMPEPELYPPALYSP